MSTAREKARTELTAELLRAARAQLSEVGPAALSLRAVAREIGMVSSAVYRYVASRDDLLTLLLVQCYDELGEAVEIADAECRRDDVRGRWNAVCRRVRAWALANPHEYALLYGSPVPGYVAPDTTVTPATRPTVVIVRIVLDAHQGVDFPPVSDEQHENISAGKKFIADEYRLSTGRELDIADEVLVRTIAAWTALFGAVSFEVFGHLVGSVTDYALFYDEIVGRLADGLELRPAAEPMSAR